MAKIEFERIERDSPANNRRRAEGKTRDLTYDFNVLIDGERRAEWHRTFAGKGYQLYDADGRKILHKWSDGNIDRSKPQDTKTKDGFMPIVLEALRDGRIPTLARMAELRAQEAADEIRRKADLVEMERVNTIERAAVDLYDALKAVAIHFNPVDATTAAIQQQVYAAIAKAEDVPQPDQPGDNL